MQIQLEIYNEGSPEGTGAAATLTGLGAGGRLAPGQRAFRVQLRLAFPTAKAADCSSRARELLRAGVAAAAGVDPLAVTIERISAPNAARGQPHLIVHMAALVGADLLKAAGLAKAVSGSSTGSAGSQSQTGGSGSGGSGSDESKAAAGEPAPADDAAASTAAAEAAAAPPSAEQLAEALGGQPLVAALGLPDPAHCAAQIEDVTPACAVSEAERAQQDAINRGDAGVAAKDDRRLAHVSWVMLHQPQLRLCSSHVCNLATPALGPCHCLRGSCAGTGWDWLMRYLPADRLIACTPSPAAGAAQDGD